MVEKIFRIFGKIITMYKNMMDSMKKPAAMESKMAKKSAPKTGLKGNQSKLDANKKPAPEVGQRSLGDKVAGRA